MLGYDGKKWSDKDRVLAAALQAYEDGLCSGCGQPRDRSFDPDMEGWYVTHARVCQGCGAVERHQHQNRDSKPLPGERLAVVDEAWGEGYVPKSLRA